MKYNFPEGRMIFPLNNLFVPFYPLHKEYIDFWTDHVSELTKPLREYFQQYYSDSGMRSVEFYLSTQAKDFKVVFFTEKHLIVFSYEMNDEGKYRYVDTSNFSILAISGFTVSGRPYDERDPELKFHFESTDSEDKEMRFQLSDETEVSIKMTSEMVWDFSKRSDWLRNRYL